ncbi:RNA-directed DNA polymerase, eukaryota [Tanacetum coccineum]
MNCLSLNVQGLGSKAKKDWIKELNNKHKVNFLSVQETKLDCISDMDVKVLWGNYKFEYTISEAVGNSGGILCVWDPSVFRKEHHVVSDNFVALYGSWVSNQAKLLVVSIYAPQSITSKRSLWSYISSLISRWDGHCMVMGDFNEVRCMEDRLGSVYNAQGANEFNSFISNSGLVEIQLEGYSFTWSLQSAKKTKLTQEVVTDYGPSPFRVYHSWFSLQGFDQMVLETWNNIDLDDKNKMVRFKKKLQILKKKIRSWVNDCKKNQSESVWISVPSCVILTNPSGRVDYMQKAKIQWAIEGDENSKFFHGIINRKRANLAIKGVMVDGEWVDDPCRVKEEFRLHFANRFRAPAANRCKLNYTFPNRLSSDQLDMLESPISRDEVRNAVWGCGENKSPGPDGFTFEFFQKFWDTLGSDFCADVEWFFDHSSFSRGCNSSFIALILKNHDPNQRPNSISCGLKQGDLWPFLFYLIMESLHLSLSRAIEAGIFKGIKIGSSLNISHLFYADDAVFIGEWSIANLSGITHILHCFSLLSGLSINLKKSHLLGVGIRSEDVMLRGMGRYDMVNLRLSILIGNLKLSVGGRLTLLKNIPRLGLQLQLATDIIRLVCRWWNLSWTPLGSYVDWLNWFNSIRLSSKVKDLLEGVLYITWWSVWMFRNQLLFSSKAPRKDVIFDDIVSRSFTWCLSRLSSEAFPNNKPSRLLPGCSENFHRGTEVHVDDPSGESRRIACQRCGGLHMCFFTNKAKSKARSCQVPPFRKLLRSDPCSTVI